MSEASESKTILFQGAVDITLEGVDKDLRLKITPKHNPDRDEDFANEIVGQMNFATAWLERKRKQYTVEKSTIVLGGSYNDLNRTGHDLADAMTAKYGTLKIEVQDEPYVSPKKEMEYHKGVLTGYHNPENNPIDYEGSSPPAPIGGAGPTNPSERVDRIGLHKFKHGIRSEKS